MAPTGDGSSKSVNANRSRKRVEAETASVTLKRAKNGSAFTRCEGCNKSVAVALISMHDCGLDAKIKMNLETIAVETATESVAKKPTERKKSVKSTKEPSTKKSKKERDPSKPKRAPTAFFLFMDDFRKTFKEANPDNKKVAVVAKEGGEKWKSMTDEEKKPYIDRAAEMKEQLQKALEKRTDVDQETDKIEKESSDVDEEDKCEDEEGPEKEVVADDE